VTSRSRARHREVPRLAGLLLEATMREPLKRLGSDEEGATALEYAILASLIAATIVALVMSLGQSVVGLFGRVVFPGG
jgi:pilus assembly protein Flp/PilA